MKSEFKIAAEASAGDARELAARLEAFNKRQTHIDDEQAVALSVRDENGKLVGGLTGVTGFGWLYVGTLWLDEDARGKGLGSSLLRAAETEAIRRGCHHACLSTFSFQAKPFYDKHGYTIFGTLDDYPQGETLYFMQKALGAR